MVLFTLFSFSAPFTVCAKPIGPVSNNILSIETDKLYTWIGTSKGVSRFRKSDGTWRHLFVESGLASNWIEDIRSDKNYVWFATNKGISVFDIRKDKFIDVKEFNIPP